MRTLILLSCFFSCALLVSSMGANLNSDVTLYFISEGESYATSSDSVDCDSGASSGSTVELKYTSSDTSIDAKIMFTGFTFDNSDSMEYGCTTQSYSTFFSSIGNSDFTTEYTDLIGMLSTTDNQVLSFSCNNSDDTMATEFLFFNGAYGIELNDGMCVLNLNTSKTTDLSSFNVTSPSVNACGFSGSFSFGNFTAMTSLTPSSGSGDLTIGAYSNTYGGNSIDITASTTYTCSSTFDGLGMMSSTCTAGTDTSLSNVVFMVTPFENGQTFLETMTMATDGSGVEFCVTILSSSIVHVLTGLVAMIFAQAYLF